MSNTLHKKFNQLKPYVIGLRFIEDMAVVDTLFKDGWSVPQSKNIKVGKSEESVNYHMFYSDDPNITLDDIMNFIEETIKINIEREKKFELLKVKVEELKTFFKNNSLSKLQNMKFVLGDVNIIPETLTEDILNTDFDLAIEEEVTPPTPPEKKVEEIKKEEVVDNEVEIFNAKFKNQDIELPPKRGEKIEVETFEIPVNDGPCTHSPETFCPKCMDKLDY